MPEYPGGSDWSRSLCGVLIHIEKGDQWNMIMKSCKFLKNLYNKRVDILEKVKLGSSKLKIKFNIITFTVLSCPVS